MSHASPNNKYGVCVVGVGARTPLGLNGPSTAAAVRGAISAIREHPFMIDKVGEVMSVAIDLMLPPEMTNSDRMYQFACAAMEEALRPLIQFRIEGVSLPIIMGLPEERPGYSTAIGDKLIRQLTISENGPFKFTRVMALHEGHAAGLMAIEKAAELIQAGQATWCLAGGVDSYMNPDTLEWLDDGGQLMSSENRSGFPPGEGAGFLLLASTAAAEKWKLPVLAWIIATSTAHEEKRIKTETICIGEGLTAAIQGVITKLNLPDEKINTAYCDMNGERYRNEEFTFTLLRTQLAFVDAIDNLTPADCWGDVGAASGPLFANLAIASGLRGYARGPRPLLWASSECGKRSAALLHLAMHHQPGVQWASR